jgi:hypothetical protein
MIRMAYVSTTNTGAAMTIMAPEGTIQMTRVDPHGVVLEADGKTFSISKDALAFLGRFFLAAGIELGVDINEGWDAEQRGGEPR